MFFELILPDLWAVDILQIYSLAGFVSVPLWAIEELIRQLTQVFQVVFDSKRDVLFCSDVARILNCGWSATIYGRIFS